MTRKEHLEFCTICLERKFDKRKGVICSLTDDIAKFEEQCDDFKKDEKAYVRPADNEEVLMANDIRSEISEEQYDALIKEQNLPMAILMGSLTAIVCAILWAVITMLTGMQFGIMAIGIGAAVGFSIRYYGKGIEPIFGIIGAVLALISCITGNLMSIVALSSAELGVSISSLLPLVEIGDLFSILFGEWLQFMDFIFYGIAAFEGFKFSMRQITEQSIREMKKH